MVADSQNDGTIYMIDTASESGKATCVKVIHKGTDICNRAYSLSISHSGDIFFTNADARKVGKLLEGSTAKHTIGSEGEMPHHGCEKTAVFVQPTGRCTKGSPLYLTDTGAGAFEVHIPY